MLQQLRTAQALNAFADEVDKQQVAILAAISTAKTAPEMKLLIQQVIAAKVSANASGLTRFNEGKKIAKLFKGHALVPATALEDIVNACQEYRHGYRASRYQQFQPLVPPQQLAPFQQPGLWQQPRF